MTLILLLVIVYIGLYVFLSVPSVQSWVKERACAELSVLLGGRIGVRSLSVTPFSEIVLNDVFLDSSGGERCASIERIGAGIDLWTLVSERKIVLNYAEILGLDVKISQAAENGPLNIQFLIDALSPKDRTKPPTRFDLRIRNIVVRKSRASFIREWMRDGKGVLNGMSKIEVSNLRMDLSIPELRNELFCFDVRNIRFDASPGMSVRSLSAIVTIEEDGTGNGGLLKVRGLNISLPKSNITVGDLDIDLNHPEDLTATLNGSVTPSDFCGLLPQLETFDTSWDINADAILQNKDVNIGELTLRHAETNSSMLLKGRFDTASWRDSLDVDIYALDINLSPVFIRDVTGITPGIDGKLRRILLSLGRVRMDMEGNLRRGEDVEVKGLVSTDIGRLDFEVNGDRLHSKKPRMKLSASGDGIRMDRLLSTDKVGIITAEIEGELTGLDRNAEGFLKLSSDEFAVMGRMLDGLNLEVGKTGDEIDVTLDATSKDMAIALDGNALLAGERSRIDTDITLLGVKLSDIGVKGGLADCNLSGRMQASTMGNNADNITGKVSLNDIKMTRADGKSLHLHELKISVDTIGVAAGDPQLSDAGIRMRKMALQSDWIDAALEGFIKPSNLAEELKGMIGSVLPTLIKATPFKGETAAKNDFDFDINIKGASAPYSFFSIPVRPLTDIPIKGSIDAVHGKGSFSMSTPHLQQGKAKLIRNVNLNIDLDSYLGMAKLNGGIIFPAKKGEAELVADIYAVRDKVNVNLGINPSMESVVKGGISLALTLLRQPNPFKREGDLAVRLDFLPSTVTVNDKVWNISDGGLDYMGKRITISNIMISHDNQYVKIFGNASEYEGDKVYVRLNDIDLEYIFNILNINYVSFGGMASGEVVGSSLLTKDLQARTEFLHVKGLSYNGAVLGDADVASEYDSEEQKVGIYAVIRDSLTRERRASVDGGIWVTRDSLSFGFDAREVNVGIMRPFVSAFCSDLYGKASGRCKLFGTFSDIDLVGDLRADTLSMKLDFTNTWYHAGGDSVYLHRGVIEIPPLTLYDDDKHTAEFSGWLRHRYFHDPVFNFRLRDAKKLLCYNTNERINPLWYGTIYGSGHAQINGNPGLIDIDMNMTTEEGSKFYYVISDAEDVAQYSFLTFTDRRKAQQKAEVVDSVPEYLKKFQKQTTELESGSSNVILSLKGTVTNDALVTLVMDPRAGDNITARGQGALQMDYNMASNDLRMIGTYVLDEGNYNFTLQDIIIKNFSIRKGSMIKFDGDPMNAILDIAATYRVNTNLSDLDKSFSTDKELNRTNVPVDAVLQVDGPMTNPDITFDIELPTLTSDVERKVKSIVSTNDMMSRQIIYLLALNRFYTPEYTGGQSNGSEWSSMASSTLSSQLSNILSQMTDKLDVAPSFRSEKGDFSDMEFDLALSSRLLNNRLLINGNFGYRDRSTSNTQFVGDFDIEYLLSKNGNLRLKAYNHFNDQNYYLRSALTTQGVGVVFRKDFDRLFRRKKDENRELETDTGIAGDSIQERAIGVDIKEDVTTPKDWKEEN